MNIIFRAACIAALLIFAGRLDAAVYHVDQKHPSASDGNDGSRNLPFRTISAAADLLAPGDEVVVHAGVYRERVAPARGGEAGAYITYRAADDGPVYIKGSELWKTGWRKAAPRVWEGYLDSKLVRDYNPFATRIVISPPVSKDTLNMTVRPAPGPKLERTLGQVFVDGVPQNQMESMEEVLSTPSSFLVSPAGNSIYVHFEGDGHPAERHIEISVRERIFAPRKRGLGYVRVKGFIMEHAANQGPFPQIAAVSSRAGKYWIFEDNVIRYAKTVGIDIGSESWGPGFDDGNVSTGHIIRNNVISDNGLVGITGLTSEGVVIRKNIIERNNRLGFYPPFDCIWWEMGGIKFHVFTNGIIEDNIVRDNDAFGIWIDNGDKGTRITRNLVLNNLLSGIFIELGTGPCIVDNNVIAYTRSGDGIYTHDALNVLICHNLCFYNSNFGVWAWNATDRIYSAAYGEYSGKMAHTDDHTVVNNILLGNAQGAVSLPVPHERAHRNMSDYNVLSDGGRWLGGQPPRFRYNLCAGDWVPLDTLLSLLETAIASGAAPPESRPSPEQWKSWQMLDLDLWRAVSKNDLHSLAVRFPRSIIRARDCEFEVEVPPEFFDIRCAPVAGIDYDYFGNPVPRKNPLPGPFQDLRQGHQKLYLWTKEIF